MQLWVAAGDREGDRQVGVWQAVPLPPTLPQELSKREVVAVGHLEVPAELAGLLRAVAGALALDSGKRHGDEGATTSCPTLRRPQAAQGPSSGPCADAPAPD